MPTGFEVSAYRDLTALRKAAQEAVEALEAALPLLQRIAAAQERLASAAEAALH